MAVRQPRPLRRFLLAVFCFVSAPPPQPLASPPSLHRTISSLLPLTVSPTFPSLLLPLFLPLLQRAQPHRDPSRPPPTAGEVPFLDSSSAALSPPSYITPGGHPRPTYFSLFSFLLLFVTVLLLPPAPPLWLPNPAHSFTPSRPSFLLSLISCLP